MGVNRINCLLPIFFERERKSINLTIINNHVIRLLIGMLWSNPYFLYRRRETCFFPPFFSVSIISLFRIEAARWLRREEWLHRGGRRGWRDGQETDLELYRVIIFSTVHNFDLKVSFTNILI